MMIVSKILPLTFGRYGDKEVVEKVFKDKEKFQGPKFHFDKHDTNDKTVIICNSIVCLDMSRLLTKPTK